MAYRPACLALLGALTVAASTAGAGVSFLGATSRPVKASEAGVTLTICQQEPVSRLWSCFGVQR